MEFLKNRSYAHSTINHESLADNWSTPNDIEYFGEAAAKGKESDGIETYLLDD